MSGERPAYVGVNGWHDPGRSDGLSNWRILLRDGAKRWTMQDTNDFFRWYTILYARFTWTVNCSHFVFLRDCHGRWLG